MFRPVTLKRSAEVQPEVFIASEQFFNPNCLDLKTEKINTFLLLLDPRSVKFILSYIN